MSGTVLIVMDFQSGVLDNVLGAAEALHAATLAVDAARAASIGVMFVRLAYRAGMPEVAVGNPVFGALRTREQFLREDAPSTSVHPSLEPRANEPVVTRRRIGAFTGSDLQLLIGAADADRVVLAGVITSGVVLSTLVQAVDLDLAVTVLRNACRDRDPELHAALVDRMFPRLAQVIDVDEWAASLASDAS